MICKCFLPFVGCLFNLLISLAVQMFFNLRPTYLMFCCWCQIQHIVVKADVVELTPVFSSWSYMVSCSVLRVVNPFWVGFLHLLIWSYGFLLLKLLLLWWVTLIDFQILTHFFYFCDKLQMVFMYDSSYVS